MVNIIKVVCLRLFLHISPFFFLVSFRYGLPVNFQAMILQPYKKTHRRLRDQLMQLYKGLDSSGMNSTSEVSTVCRYYEKYNQGIRHDFRI